MEIPAAKLIFLKITMNVAEIHELVQLKEECARNVLLEQRLAHACNMKVSDLQNYIRVGLMRARAKQDTRTRRR